ncbi:MAG: hypothetical protein EOO00_03010 [Chitinophagaceae bacterium]|nr:MAG: hypothetical protein EOO00_03010 [Chitinophagaceae bacterium]
MIARELNRIETNVLNKGQVVQIGWVRYDATDITKKKDTAATGKTPVKAVIRKDQAISSQKLGPISVKVPVTDTLHPVADSTISEGEQQYLAQTNDGMSESSEKGTAVFFKRVGRSTNGIYLAFHNTAKRGTILKVTNLGTNKTVYARVIGPVPKTGQYYNALVGISNDAVVDLDVRDEKAWCEISFAP